ncbi:IS66-like element accessory protein TnpA [Paraburkholderia sp. Cpub6]|uniref:IS66-like element accessory protein TnpA n=1 Tax=Paraburkholderia sp. Cpub6 TaxID=2723094 RepID=UPI00160CCDD7|nr:transposase [Paraburkholderia sp. Cpub6]MBB5463380.1 transposase [Paraburkholderia sp. Cpub6]
MTEIDCAGSRKGRPNYAPEFRREVAMAACEPGISVAKLAQSHGLNPNMVFKWRRQYRAGLLDNRTVSETAMFVPVAMSPDDSMAVSSLPVPTAQLPLRVQEAATSGIEIELNGARVRVSGKVDPAQLRLVLHCLRPA